MWHRLWGGRWGPPRKAWWASQTITDKGAVPRNRGLCPGPGPGGRLDSWAGGLSWERAPIDQLQHVFVQTRQGPPILPSIAPSPGPLSPCSWFYGQGATPPTVP